MRRLLEMNSRLLLLCILLAPLALCDPLTLTFAGTGSGSLGSDTFTGSNFTITFTTDTSDLATPGGYPNDISTPEGTSATFSVTGVGSGTLTGNQAVFVNDTENDVGIWFFQPPDFLTLGNFSFATYKLSSSIGPISGTASALSESIPTSVEGESLSLTGVSALTFTADVTAASSGGGGGGGATVPEPATWTLSGVVLGVFLLANLRRKLTSRHP